MHESQRRLTDAETSYRRPRRQPLTSAGYRFNLARILVNLGRIDDALAQLSPLATPDDAESVRYVYASSALLVRKGDLVAGRRMGEDALARARRHGLTDLAATIERDLQKLK